MGLIERIRTFNIFENPEKTSEVNVKNQRLSTRIVFILIVLSSIGILLYASLTGNTKAVDVENPSFSLYKSLQNKYPQTSVCPCTSVLNSYNKFIFNLQPILNQICSSDFISDEWINYINYRSKRDVKYHYYLDFRHSAYSFFTTIKTLCQLISSSISDQLIAFYRNTLFTENTISEETFNATVVAFRDHFISLTTNAFLVSLDSFRLIMEGDNIANRLETNIRLRSLEVGEQWIATVFPITYEQDSCNCWKTLTCKETTGIYTRNTVENTDYLESPFNNTLQFSVPGVNVGCYIIGTVLQSDLSCLYNSSCLSQLHDYLIDSEYPLTANITPLKISSSSNQLPTINELINSLLVDEWLFNFSYQSYFNECNPSTCSYTYKQSFDIIYVITTIIAFLGGIITILMLLILPMVTFLRNRFKSPVINITSGNDKFSSSSFHLFSCFLFLF